MASCRASYGGHCGLARPGLARRLNGSENKEASLHYDVLICYRHCEIESQYHELMYGKRPKITHYVLLRYGDVVMSRLVCEQGVEYHTLADFFTFLLH